MKGSTEMIRSMDSVCTHGAIRNDTLAGGVSASNMDSVCLYRKKVRGNWGCGTTAKS